MRNNSAASLRFADAYNVPHLAGRPGRRTNADNLGMHIVLDSIGYGEAWVMGDSSGQ